MNKSPFNYIGNKYQIMQQLLDIFPDNINTFVDVFSGGCDVITNVSAKNKIAIDVNSYTMDIMREFQSHSLEDILKFIYHRIDEFQLSKTNEEGYLKYREAYNNNLEYHTPLDLYTLSRFSFHFTMRFNNDLKMNAGFGRGFSNFSSRQQRSIVQFHKDIQSVELLTMDFKQYDFSSLGKDDFIYFDPPYLITNNVYNNGVERAWQRWTEVDERVLLRYIDNVNDAGIKFALSNVLHHRGKTNTILQEWINKNSFNIHNIKTSYSHCTHTVNQKDEPTTEIVVTNY